MSYISKVENDSIILQIKELTEDYPELFRYEMDKESYPRVRIDNIVCCSGCDRSSDEVKIKGHLKKCKWRAAKREFSYLVQYINRWELKNIELILMELSE